jgi:predicted nucleic acid-binding protein
LPDWVKVKNLDESYEQKAAGWSMQIDAGEAAAIALTLQEQAEWLLSDDAQARQFAESLGLEVHGSIGLLLWAMAAEHVANQKEALELLDALAHSSLWISERVLRQARKAIGKIFSE